MFDNKIEKIMNPYSREIEKAARLQAERQKEIDLRRKDSAN